MSAAVSIIVPIYNVEKYLTPCVESILTQTLENIEVILVNDGSTDRCGEIAEEFAVRDSRVKVIHQPNGGSSSARNAGVRLASGEYVGFVDPDDWIEADMYEALYTAATNTNADGVICALYEFYEDTGRTLLVRYPFLPFLTNRQDPVRRDVLVPLLTGQLHAFTWNKLYRKALLVNHGIESPEDMPLMQDAVFNQDAFAVMNKVVYIDRPLYHFRRHSASNTMKFRPDVFDTLLRLLHEKENCLHRTGLAREYRKAVYEWFIRQVLHAVSMEFGAANKLPHLERRARIRRIVNDPDIRRALQLVNVKTNWIQEAAVFGMRRRNTSFVMAASVFYNKYMSVGRTVKRTLFGTRRDTASHV